MINPEEIRARFPVLDQEVNGHPLIYLDNAATTQKPDTVIKSVTEYYEKDNSNVHRGIHTLSQRASDGYDETREKIRGMLGAKEAEEIIFVRGTTEGINLVANGFLRRILEPGDEILVSQMEHHANIVPWQLVAHPLGAKIKSIPMDENGDLMIEKIEGLINSKTKFISVVHVSNSLGTINPVKEICEIAKKAGVPILIDGAQAVPHMNVDVLDIGCDFYVFSGHKMYGPTGIGAVYGKRERLEEMDPYQGGGDMIRSVTFEETTYNQIPAKLEAGTPNIAGTIGLGKAIDYLKEIGIENIEKYESELLEYATEKIGAIDKLTIIGSAKNKASVVSFTIDGIHSHDIGGWLDEHGIAVRTGHHCTQPAMNCYGINSTARASFSHYNTKEEVDKLVVKLKEMCDWWFG